MTDIKSIARPCILRRRDYVPGKPAEEVTRELGITDIVKMASNENPLGGSPKAIAAMIDEISARPHLYPESLAPDLRAKLARKYGVTPDHIFIDNGLDGVLTLVGMTFINPGDEIIFGEVTFPAYENITDKMDGVRVVIPNRQDFSLDVDGFLAAVTPKTKIIFLCNPNNPTGTINTRAEFERLLKGTPENVLLVTDEAYYEFAEDPEYPQSLDHLAQYPNLIILRTFSKIMGLAGLRVGYAIAHPDVVKVMMKSRDPFPVNRIAQAGALAAMDDPDFVARTLAVNLAGRRQLTRGMEALGLRVAKSQTNFVMAYLGQPAVPVFEAVLREGVIIRPLGGMNSPQSIRISIGTEEQNARALAALLKVLGK